MIHIKRHFYLIVISFLILPNCSDKSGEIISVLILSGKNNHDWEKTTPVLVDMYLKYPGFKVSVTNAPDTLNYDKFIEYDVLVSNWNNWPGDSNSWDENSKEGFERFIREGGGAVFFHAGGSSFYDWDVYHRVGIGRWGKNTSHGKQTTGRITEFDKDHPITKDLVSFHIIDEIWENTDIHPTADTLAYIKAQNPEDMTIIYEPAVFINKTGKGRSFYTILGHNKRALFNTGFQTLLIRATQWAANRDINIDIPRELRISQEADRNFSWLKTDSSFSLMQNNAPVWQYNFNTRFGKPFFHPLYTDRNRMTTLSPDDHPWHLGLWFSWKFINGSNYWEYLNDFKSEETGFRAEGTTDIKEIQINKNKDLSCEIILNIEYFTEGSDPILNESRKLYISTLSESGNYYLDFENLFIPLIDSVILDRTPIMGEPDGKSWGGYGGLSIRFNQDFTDPVILPSVPDGMYPKNEWFYMGFNTLTGNKAGICMMQHPDFTTPYTRWYYVIDPGTPFYFFSPAALYDSKIVLKKEDSLRLKYRVWILNGLPEMNDLNSKYIDFLKK